MLPPSREASGILRPPSGQPEPPRVPCAEYQADGAPCPDPTCDCDRCARARAARRTEPRPDRPHA